VTTKFERQGTILRLVQQQHLSTQAEVAEALKLNGIDAVQATVSRDITQLGLVKVRNDAGRLVYALPGAADLRRLDELTTALRRWMGETAPSGTILVVNTPRGFAAALADAIDDSGHPLVLGTIAGENMIFVAPREGVSGTRLRDELRTYLLEGAA
jgi:transcriptional regulator of arginine metabolism